MCTYFYYYIVKVWHNWVKKDIYSSCWRNGRVDSGKKQRSMFKQLIPSGVWKEIEETQNSVEIQVFDRRGVCPYCIERGRSPEFLYLAMLRGLLVVFSRAAQTIAWIWMSRRAHPSFYFLRCNWKRSHVCQKLCLDNTVHPLVPSCMFSPFKYIFLFRANPKNYFFQVTETQHKLIDIPLKFLIFYLDLLFIYSFIKRQV